jgi:hypothetical protein
MNTNYLKGMIAVHSDKETYKHDMAKYILMNWLMKDYTVKLEEPFDTFRPDLTAYMNNTLVVFYEVVHKCEMTGEKLHRIQKWCYQHDTSVPVYEVNADYILDECKRPDDILKVEYITV